MTRSRPSSGADATPIDTVMCPVSPGASGMIADSVRSRSGREDRSRTPPRVARRHVLLANAGAQQMGERPQRFIAGGMAVPVVEFFEVIEVEHQHGEWLAIRPIGQHLLEGFVEGSAVCQ